MSSNQQPRSLKSLRSSSMFNDCASNAHINELKNDNFLEGLQFNDKKKMSIDFDSEPNAASMRAENRFLGKRTSRCIYV